MNFRNLIYIVLFVLTGAAVGWAQTAGFYGKRNYLELDGLFNFRLFGIILDDLPADRAYLQKKNGVLEKKRDLFNSGFRINVGRAVSNNFGLALETGIDFQNVAGYDDLRVFNGTSSEVFVDHETFNVRTFSVMPKMVFTRSGGLIPIGLNHELGIGITSSRVLEKDYAFTISDTTGMTLAIRSKIDDQFIDYDQRFGGMTFLYGLNMKIPLNRQILVNYGLRYTLHIRNYLKDYDPGDGLISNKEVSASIGRMRFTNLITLSLGVSYSF